MQPSEYNAVVRIQCSAIQCSASFQSHGSGIQCNTCLSPSTVLHNAVVRIQCSAIQYSASFQSQGSGIQCNTCLSPSAVLRNAVVRSNMMKYNTIQPSVPEQYNTIHSSHQSLSSAMQCSIPLFSPRAVQ